MRTLAARTARPGWRGVPHRTYCAPLRAVAAAHTQAREPNRVLKASLDAILARYYAATPSAADVIQRVYAEGYGTDQVVHDHFAFRTFGLPGLGIESFGAALEGFGYARQDFYTFPRTHLLAAWYAPPRELYGVLPRVFVSQLQVSKLSPAAQALVHSYTDEVAAALSSQVAAAGVPHSGLGGATGATGGDSSHTAAMLGAWTAAVTGALPWRTPSRSDWEALLAESEYGAWVLANGYSLNHTALSVHAIVGRQGDIYSFANELVMKGFTLNDEGGFMKVSPDSGLLQCSTVADVIDNYKFDDGQTGRVVGAYMEFVERKPLPQHSELAATGRLGEVHRRDGFETGSAQNIFASTTLAAAGAAGCWAAAEAEGA